MEIAIIYSITVQLKSEKREKLALIIKRLDYQTACYKDRPVNVFSKILDSQNSLDIKIISRINIKIISLNM